MCQYTVTIAMATVHLMYVTCQQLSDSHLLLLSVCHCCHCVIYVRVYVLFLADTLRPSLAQLEVLVVEAADLKASDPNGKSDPFCVIKFANQEQATHHIPKTLNPKWNAKVRDSGMLVWGLGMLVRGLGMLVQDLGMLVRGSGMLVRGSGMLVRGSGMLVRGLGMLVWGSGMLVWGSGVLVYKIQCIVCFMFFKACGCRVFITANVLFIQLVFDVKDPSTDTLEVTVFDRDMFSPNGKERPLLLWQEEGSVSCVYAVE